MSFSYRKAGPSTNLRLNLDVSLLKKDMRPCGPIAEVSCEVSGTAPGPLYAFGVLLTGPPWNVLRLCVPLGNLLLPTGDTGIEVLTALEGAVLQKNKKQIFR